MARLNSRTSFRSNPLSELVDIAGMRNCTLRQSLFSVANGPSNTVIYNGYGCCRVVILGHQDNLGTSLPRKSYVPSDYSQAAQLTEAEGKA